MMYNLKTGLTGLAIIASSLPLAAGEAPATYVTPQDAFEAFHSALGNSDAVLEVFGTASLDFLSSGDAETDAENSAELKALVSEGYRFTMGEEGRLDILLGAEAWPFPIPLAKTEGNWAFDVEEGRNEVYFRRIGLNELEAIDLLSAYVDIQTQYRLVDHDSDGVMEFASSILSNPDARDGLVWADADSPLGVRFAEASLDGYNDGENDVEPEPLGGYYYRVLKSQGDSAPGGAFEYMIGENMVAGHALLAVPSVYGETGVHSFMVSENGVVMEADLGETTLDTAFDMLAYAPDTAWSPVALNN